MGQYDVTISIFSFAPIIAAAIAGVILSMVLFVYILRKDPTIMWRARHLSWSYSFWKSPSDDIKILPVMEEDIDPTSNTFDYIPKGSKQAYTHSLNTTVTQGSIKLPATKDSAEKRTKEQENQDIPESMKKKTRFTYKGHPAFIHSFDSFDPHSFVPNSLEAVTSPAAVYKTKDGNVRRQIDSIRVTDPIQKTSIGLIILSVIIIIALIAMYGQNANILGFLQSHFPGNPNNSTSTPQTCPTGYIMNTSGRCVPQMPMISIFGLLIPSLSFSLKNWRKYLGFSKTQAVIASILSIIFLPATALSFIISKLNLIQTIGDTGNTDMIIIVTSVCFWITMWKIGSIIGDRLFRKNNPWSKNVPINKARRLFKLTRRQSTYKFWLRMDQSVRIEHWLEFFYDIRRPTAVFIGVLP